jgi:hypothetical protein
MRGRLRSRRVRPHLSTLFQLRVVSRLRRYAERLSGRRFPAVAPGRQSVGCWFVHRQTFAQSNTKDLDSRWRQPEARDPALPRLRHAPLSSRDWQLAPIPWLVRATMRFLIATVKPRNPRQSTMLLSRLLVSVWLSMISPWFSQTALRPQLTVSRLCLTLARGPILFGLEAEYGQRDQPMRQCIGSGFSRSAEREGSEADLWNGLRIGACRRQGSEEKTTPQGVPQPHVPPEAEQTR